nr:hypothetical protein [Tanacetum cinerariifolium]
MARHLTGPKRKHAQDAIDAICAKCYIYNKYRFKRDEKDGYRHPDVLRPKSLGNMPIDDWNRHIDFFLRPDQTKKSETNSKNRSKQPYPSVHGKMSIAASRYKRAYFDMARHLTGPKRTEGNPDEYPSLVSDIGLNHTSKATGTYVNEAAATKHKELQDALKSSQESGVNVPEKEVVKKILGTRSGHTRGVGRKLKWVSSSSSFTSSSSNYCGGSKTYTQDEVNDLFKTKKLENMMTQLAEKGMYLDKTPVVSEEDAEYKESDDEEMEVLDEDENEDEDEEINDGDDSVK